MENNSHEITLSTDKSQCIIIKLFKSLTNKLFFLINRSLSIIDVFYFLLNGVLTYAVTLLLIIGAEWILIDGINNIDWKRAFIFPVILLFVTYIRENINTRKRENKLKHQKVFYNTLGGVIDQMVACVTECPDDSNHTIAKILIAAEKITKLTIESNGWEPGNLCANLMKPIKYRGTRLKIKHFGTRWPERGRTELKVDLERPTPGAVEAFLFKSATYVNNTESTQFKDFFPDDRPYKSIISIPIIDNKEEVYVIMNIDSDRKDAFVSRDFISKKILVKLRPLTSLLFLLENKI